MPSTFPPRSSLLRGTHDDTPDIVRLQCLLAGIVGSLGGSEWRQKGEVIVPHHSVSESPAHAAEDECDPVLVLFILFFYASRYFMLQSTTSIWFIVPFICV